MGNDDKVRGPVEIPRYEAPPDAGKLRPKVEVPVGAPPDETFRKIADPTDPLQLQKGTYDRVASYGDGSGAVYYLAHTPEAKQFFANASQDGRLVYREVTGGNVPNFSASKLGDRVFIRVTDQPAAAAPALDRVVRGKKP